MVASIYPELWACSCRCLSCLCPENGAVGIRSAKVTPDVWGLMIRIGVLYYTVWGLVQRRQGKLSLISPPLCYVALTSYRGQTKGLMVHFLETPLLPGLMVQGLGCT